MKRILAFLLIPLSLIACKNAGSFRTYEQAEQEFRASLTFHDTLSVLMLGQNFMDAMRGGTLDVELAELCVVYNDTLYKVSPKSLVELKSIYGAVRVSDYALNSYSFSTPGNNDLSYRYVTSGKVGSGGAFKIMFNPVKVGDNWYLTLKDGNMSSQDKAEALQVHPLSPAPKPIVLNSTVK